MYLFYTTFERKLDDVLKCGLLIHNDWHSRSKQRPLFWLSPDLGAEIRTKADLALFRHLHSGMAPLVGETGKRIFGFSGAVTIKVRVRQDQVRNWRDSDIKDAAVQRLLSQNIASDRHHLGSEWHVADRSILPNQIIGVSTWTSDDCGSKKVQTTRYLARVLPPQTSREIGSDSMAA